MFSWEEKTLLQVSNESDHSNVAAVPKQLSSGATLSAQGRYTVHLARTPRPDHSLQQIAHRVLEEMGLEETEPQAVEQVQQGLPGQDLVAVFGRSHLKLEGEAAFKAEQGVGDIEGVQAVVNDGNTMVHLFWDKDYYYVLLHEVKY